MEQRLIDEHIQFKYHIGWGTRWWLMNGQQHRDDDGPTHENVNRGHCQWWKHGELMRAN